MWGGTGMLIGAAVSASAETIGALAFAGAAGAAAAEVADVAAADASKLDGATVASDTAGGPKPAASEPAAAEPPAGESPAAEPSRPAADGCNSFAAGTAVLMADGSSKPIQDIHVGDQITNKDPETGQVQTHTVMATHITDDDHDFVDLTVQTQSGASTVTVTANHLFWDETKRSWIEAAAVDVGDQFDTAGKDRVTAAASRRYVGSMRTYNVTIDEVHTYWIFVGSGSVLVHNCDGTYGTAYVHADPAAPQPGGTTGLHMSIRIDGAVDGAPFSIHSELVGLNIAKVRPFSGSLSAETRTFSFKLEDPEMARDYVELQLRKPTVGRYDPNTNNCVTYACNVLRAGGYRDLPTTGPEGAIAIWG
jgi:hypothetical protein